MQLTTTSRKAGTVRARRVRIPNPTDSIVPSSHRHSEAGRSRVRSQPIFWLVIARAAAHPSYRQLAFDGSTHRGKSMAAVSQAGACLGPNALNSHSCVFECMPMHRACGLRHVMHFAPADFFPSAAAAAPRFFAKLDPVEPLPLTCCASLLPTTRPVVILAPTLALLRAAAVARPQDRQRCGAKPEHAYAAGPLQRHATKGQLQMMIISHFAQSLVTRIYQSTDLARSSSLLLVIVTLIPHPSSAPERARQGKRAAEKKRELAVTLRSGYGLTQYSCSSCVHASSHDQVPSLGIMQFIGHTVNPHTRTRSHVQLL
ncbi:hypothetical protein L1887_53948 [Cichorium endivia]|nr:hypothetical protein L1887_53948 [Cichorium endivia]